MGEGCVLLVVEPIGLGGAIDGMLAAGCVLDFMGFGTVGAARSGLGIDINGFGTAWLPGGGVLLIFCFGAKFNCPDAGPLLDGLPTIDVDGWGAAATGFGNPLWRPGTDVGTAASRPFSN